jgi:catechol 2,3-dioxygenase-like lactoylglutathione lyase family enzyme
VSCRVGKGPSAREVDVCRSEDQGQKVGSIQIACFAGLKTGRLMKLGYTIIYVPNVAESLLFFERAFGLSRRFLHESGDYGELETGETTLAFASHDLGNMNFPSGFVASSESSKPLGIEIALVTPSVVEAHTKALAAGAAELKSPETKPWGQVVSYVRCPDGTLVEICSPVAG